MENTERQSEIELICELRKSVNSIESPVTIYIADLWTDRNWEGSHQSVSSSLHASKTTIDKDVDLGDMLIIKECVTSYLQVITWYLDDQLSWATSDNSNDIETIEPTGDSIEGAIVVSWSWEKYVGYARNFGSLRYGNFNEKSVDLISGNEDRTFRSNESVLLTAKEIEGLEGQELLDRINEELALTYWKWNYFRNRATTQKIVDSLNIDIQIEEEEEAE